MLKKLPVKSLNSVNEQLKYVGTSFPKIILLLIVTVFFLLAHQLKSDSLPTNNQIQNQLVSAISTAFTADLPQEVNEITVLQKIKLFGVRGMEYVYQLKKNKKHFDSIPEFYDSHKETTTQEYCSNESTEWYRTNFVEIKWTYLDSENTALFSFKVNPNDC